MIIWILIVVGYFLIACLAAYILSRCNMGWEDDTPLVLWSILWPLGIVFVIGFVLALPALIGKVLAERNKRK